MTKTIAAAAAGLLCAAAPPAHAAIVTKTFELNAANFSPAAPIDPVYGKFTVTFDNAASFDATTSGLTVHSFNLPHPVKFAYFQLSDSIALSDNPSSGSCGARSDGTNFCTFIGNISTAPSADFFYYSMSSGAIYTAGTVSAALAGVPEPATWALMILGFGAVAGALRRRRGATAAVRFA